MYQMRGAFFVAKHFREMRKMWLPRTYFAGDFKKANATARHLRRRSESLRDKRGLLGGDVKG